MSSDSSAVRRLHDSIRRRVTPLPPNPFRRLTSSTSGNGGIMCSALEQNCKHRPYHSWQLVFRNPADFMKS